LRCYAFTEQDPFCILRSPHVYFVTNQNKYEDRLIHEEGLMIKLISVPKFKKTGCFALLDLNTLKSYQIKFQLS
jgi:DNA polymerase delta subunit 2